jgi:hypothetical protein
MIIPVNGNLFLLKHEKPQLLLADLLESQHFLKAEQVA